MATAAAERLEKVRSILFFSEFTHTRRAHGSAFISLHGIAARRTGTS
jgi:hypothetical protein